jgi:ketosteroid isomerase-like protein
MSDRIHDIEANKRIARDFLDALSSGDPQRILASYTDDATVWTAGSLPFSGLHARDEVVGLCEGLLGAFPQGLEFTVKAMTAEGERVAIEAEGLGTHASGKVYHQRYHFLLVIREGKVAEMREYFDTELAREVLLAGAG